METFELKYFLGVARTENIHQASQQLNVSPGSLSKAVQRIETELGVKLFSRQGRNIKLTAHGSLLQLKASEIVRLEEAARIEIGGNPGSLHITLTGPEVLLSHQGITLSESMQKRFPLASFEFEHASDEESLAKIQRGDAHLALTTTEPSKASGLTSKVIGETKFLTFVGLGHPLYAQTKAKKSIPVARLLEYPFVSPNHPVLGKVAPKQSLDGWRDDQFPRKIGFLTSSLRILEQMVVSGRAIAYLPEVFAKHPGLEVIKVTGCPYTCVQKIRLVAKNPKELGWLNHWF